MITNRFYFSLPVYSHHDKPVVTYHFFRTFKGFPSVSFGGDEGSRTPVRKPCHATFSERRPQIVSYAATAYGRAAAAPADGI